MRLILVLLANATLILWQGWSPDSLGPNWYVGSFMVCCVWAFVGDYLEYTNVYKNIKEGGR